MKGPGVDQDAAVHMSSTLTPLNKAVDTAMARVECGRTPVGRLSPPVRRHVQCTRKASLPGVSWTELSRSPHPRNTQTAVLCV